MARGIAWGDIRLVDFGRPDKKRPCVVLTRGSAIPYLNAVTVAPITKTVRGVPTELTLNMEDGLKTLSAMNLDALQTVSKERLGRYVGSVHPGYKFRLREALLFALELDDDVSNI